jgi:ribosomal protein S18 acetylase RimI-like enzyme
MEEFFIRSANTQDIPFLVDTIIEAEKSGTDKLSYTTVFGLTENETRKYITEMLLEETDHCELSVSSFMIAEKDNQFAAAVGAWEECADGIPSSVLKGNLLNYFLPKNYIQQALSINQLLSELHLECKQGSIQLGLVYVASDYRGKNLVRILIDKQIERLTTANSNLKEMYVQVFGNNLPAIKAYEKVGFVLDTIKESANDEILVYLPGNKKIVMKKSINK